LFLADICSDSHRFFTNFRCFSPIPGQEFNRREKKARGMYRSLLTFLALLNLHVILQAQTDTTDRQKIIQAEISYVGDVLGNLTGGIHTGTCYLGMANIRISFSTEAAHLWKGGELFINGANTHGDQPSDEMLGDLQVASNIEAGNHTFLQELWYRQTWKFAEVTVGLQDLNINFVNSTKSWLFRNSSFGVLPTVSGNVPAPIFPLTSLGVTANWKLTRKLNLLNAVYDGSATDFDKNPHNLNWDLGAGEGLLIFNELQRKTKLRNMPGIYKAGIYIHTHLLPEEDDHDEDVDTAFRSSNGIYFIGDQMIWRNPGGARDLWAFMQLGYSPKKMNTNNYYIGLGLNFSGLFSLKGKDMAGLAFAFDGLRGSTGNEIVLELTYLYTVLSFLYLQPDIQYIINPAGTGEHLDNCLAVTLRFGINL